MRITRPRVRVTPERFSSPSIGYVSSVCDFTDTGLGICRVASTRRQSRARPALRLWALFPTPLPGSEALLISWSALVDLGRGELLSRIVVVVAPVLGLLGLSGVGWGCFSGSAGGVAEVVVDGFFGVEFVDSGVVGSAEEDEVSKGGFATVCPVDDMVGVAP